MPRSAFREAVLGLRNGSCCAPGCTEPAVDAHHIIERRLWTAAHELGGYLPENGAPLCGEHHYQAEQTLLSADTLRQACGHRAALLPEGFYLDPDIRYTKWGDHVLEDGTRLPGPMFYDESVQKVLRDAGVLDLYRDRVKYPRTFHLPWSPGRSDDDKALLSVDGWADVEMVATEKMDGENTTVYPDGYLHARSVDSRSHPSRSRVTADAQQWAFDIPEGWRVVGENMTAVHSIAYAGLPDRFLVHSIWDRNTALGWDETVEWCALLGVEHAPVLWRGSWTVTARHEIHTAWEALQHVSEGYVLRPASRYQLRGHAAQVGKYVRHGHVGESRHWMHRAYSENGFA